MSQQRDLEAIARELFETWCNEKNFTNAFARIDANAEQTHDDRPPIKGKDNMQAVWSQGYWASAGLPLSDKGHGAGW
jgi:hypothetical protein